MASESEAQTGVSTEEQSIGAEADQQSDPSQDSVIDLSVTPTEAGGASVSNWSSLSGTLAAYPHHIVYSAPQSHTKILVDSINAVEYRKDRWNWVIALGGFFILLGMFAMLSNIGTAIMLFIIGGMVAYIGLLLREENLVIVTAGKEFHYRTRSSQEDEKAVNTISQLRIQQSKERN